MDKITIAQLETIPHISNGNMFGDFGSYLGPLTFITLVDSLQVSCMMHKFVDDTTLSEFIAKSGRSGMNACCDELVQQSNEIKMNVNGRKTERCCWVRLRKIHRHQFRCA